MIKPTLSQDQLLAQMRSIIAQMDTTQSSPVTPTSQQGDFSSMLTKSIGEVNKLQTQSATMAEAFQRGDNSVNVSDLMVAMQKSSLSFQAMVQVRNKMVSAYQEIMNMQI